MLNWFKAGDAKKFGLSIAQFYIDRVPNEKKTDKKSRQKEQEVIEKMVQQINQFKAQHKMNLYKTAQLANTFKWALKEAGYDSAEIERLTKLLIHL